MSAADQRVIHAFADADAFLAEAYERNWTDGLPVVPPTPERVEALCDAVARAPDDVVAELPPVGADATVERIATNAVMAGCLPEHLPVVIAAIEACSAPEFDLRAVQATTHPCGILLVVSGRAAVDLGINGSSGCFGPGNRANATIGRAVRLVLQNVGGARPGSTDHSTQGSPAKFSFCVAEDHSVSPWEPFHVAQGFPEGTSTVSVAAAENPHNLNDHVSKTAEGLLLVIANSISNVSANNAYNRDSDYYIALCPEHANLLGRNGWSRRDVQEYLFERARVPYPVWRRGGMFGMTPQPKFMEAMDDGYRVPMTLTPDDVRIFVAGGGGRHSAFMPTYSAVNRSVTREIAGYSHTNEQRSDMFHAGTAVREITDSLASNGYALEIRDGVSGSYAALVRALPDACADCLVPVETFRSILIDALERDGVTLDRDQLEVEYPTDH